MNPLASHPRTSGRFLLPAARPPARRLETSVPCPPDTGPVRPGAGRTHHDDTLTGAPVPTAIQSDSSVLSGPTVDEIREAVRASIAGGAYLQGALLSVGRIAADVGCARHRLDRVRLAVTDLQSDGLCSLTESADLVRIAVRRPAPAATQRVADWLHELIRAGVHPPHSALPSRQTLARAMVTPPSVVTSALRLLADENVITLGWQRPTVTWTPDLPGAPDLVDLRSRLAAIGLPPGAPDFSSIRQTCSLTRTWWTRRTVPHPDKHRATFGELAAATADLMPMAAFRHAHNPDALTILRRAAVTALADWPSDPYGQVWRTACLGASVREVTLLAMGPA